MLKKINVAVFVVLGLLFSSNLAYAVSPDEKLADPKLEQRARDLSAGLRCLVCQNQSIDDSKAGLAKDLRLLVRERLKKGDSDEQVMEFVVARYGDFVLLKPPFNLYTMMLWLAPLLLLLAGIVMIRRFNAEAIKKLAAEEKAESVAQTKLSEEEQARLKRLLEE